MPLVDEIAYPRLNSHPSARDLETCFTPTPDELLWTRSVAILDRVLHNGYKLELQGESLRKKKRVLTRDALEAA